MKIKDRFFEQDDEIVRERVFDATPFMEDAKTIRDATGGRFGESVHIGRVPLAMVTEWLKEAGVSWDDPAAQHIILAKMQERDFSKFRVWEGRV